MTGPQVPREIVWIDARKLKPQDVQRIRDGLMSGKHGIGLADYAHPWFRTWLCGFVMGVVFILATALVLFEFK